MKGKDDFWRPVNEFNELSISSEYMVSVVNMQFYIHIFTIYYLLFFLYSQPPGPNIGAWVVGEEGAR